MMMSVLKRVERQWFLGCVAVYAASMTGGKVFAQGQGGTIDQALGGIAGGLDETRLLPWWGIIAGIAAVAFAGASMILRDKKWLWGSAGCIVGAAFWYSGGDMIMKWIPTTGSAIANHR